MKFTIIAFAAITVAFAACSNNNTADSQAATLTDSSAATPANTTAPTPVVASNEIIDPVCGMVKDSTWTDYTVYKGDTVWFCAAPEKTAFEANPEKYAGSLPKH